MKLLLIFVFATALFSQTATYVGLGNASTYTDVSGILWSADTGCSGGTQFTSNNSIQGTSDPTLYQHGRLSTSAFSCTYTVSNNIFYNITLKFANTQSFTVGQRIFNIFINNTLVKGSFDLAGTGIAQNSAFDLGFLIPVSNSQVSINLQPINGGVLLNAISIVASGPGTLTGNNTFTGSNTFTGGTTISSGIIYMGGTAFPCTLAGINTAIQALPAAPVGGTIYLCSGIIPGSNTVVFDRPVHMIGQKGGYNGRGTLLNWTGGASAIMTLGPSASASSSILEDFGITNNGTATVCLEIDSTAGLIDVHLKDLYICDFPAVVPSIAAARFGVTNSGPPLQNLFIDHVAAEGNSIGFQFLRGNNIGINFLRATANTTNDIQIGGTSAGQTITGWRCANCDLEAIASTTEVNVLINNAQGVQFDAAYAEPNGNYWLDCPSTAVECSNIFINGFRATPAAGTFQYIFDSNLSTATMIFKSLHGVALPASSFWVRNQNSRRIAVDGTSSDNTNTTCISSFTNASCVNSLTGSTVNNNVISPPSTFNGTISVTNVNLTNLLLSVTAPTISTHFNTSGDSIAANGTGSFIITVGTGTGTNTGALSLPTATTGWNCWLTNQTRAAQIQQTNSTDREHSATFTNFGTTFAATNWTNSDVLRGGCAAN